MLHVLVHSNASGLQVLATHRRRQVLFLSVLLLGEEAFLLLTPPLTDLPQERDRRIETMPVRLCLRGLQRESNGQSSLRDKSGIWLI